MCVDVAQLIRVKFSWSCGTELLKNISPTVTA
jgi:hypothetical protein